MNDIKNKWLLFLFCWVFACVGCNMPISPIDELDSLPVEDAIVGEGILQDDSQTAQPNAAAVNENTLRLTYEIEWRVDPTDPGYALASVRLNATGGDGFYTFYRDETVTNSANFVYRWGSCKDNSGTFRVDSADGQTTIVEYFEQPPCPDRGQAEASNP